MRPWQCENLSIKSGKFPAHLEAFQLFRVFGDFSVYLETFQLLIQSCAENSFTNCLKQDFCRKPFLKFICNSASYFFFLFLLILASQRIEDIVGYEEDDDDGDYVDYDDDGVVKMGATIGHHEARLSAFGC